MTTKDLREGIAINDALGRITGSVEELDHAFATLSGHEPEALPALDPFVIEPVQVPLE